jgi:hypothetical protein
MQAVGAAWPALRTRQQGKKRFSRQTSFLELWLDSPLAAAISFPHHTKAARASGRDAKLLEFGESENVRADFMKVQLDTFTVKLNVLGRFTGAH